MIEDKEKWFFSFRQIIPRPPGHWVACGPYQTYDEAKVARENAKAWDAQVGTPFVASGMADAQEKCGDAKNT